LEDQNYSVQTAQDGFQAWEIINRQLPELVILDLMMPRMNGYELCEKIRESYDLSLLPVIILTARTQTEDLLQGFKSGANDFLTKPVDREELLARVRTHLQIKQLADLFRENKELKKEINRRKLAEENLSTAHRRLVHLLDASEDAILMIDQQHKILFFNQGAERTFGYKMDEVMNTALDRLIPEFPDSISASSYPVRLTGDNTGQLHGEYHPVTIINSTQSELNTKVLVVPMGLEDDGLMALIFRDDRSTSRELALTTPQEKQTIDPELMEELAHHRNKVQAMQSAFNQVLDFLNQGGQELISEVRNIDASMEKTAAALPSKDRAELFRKTLVEVTNQSLEIWTEVTDKGKIELAEESDIWKVYLSQGTFQTRTFDKYLSLAKLPRNPRWREVARTARYILKTCPEPHPLKPKLQANLIKLMTLAEYK